LQDNLEASPRYATAVQQAMTLSFYGRIFIKKVFYGLLVFSFTP